RRPRRPPARGPARPTHHKGRNLLRAARATLGPRLPIAVLTAGRSARRSHRVVQDVPFALSWRLSPERTRFARAPPSPAFETDPPRPAAAPLRGPLLFLCRFPRRPGTPLLECRGSLSRSSGGPAASETSPLSKERL